LTRFCRFFLRCWPSVTSVLAILSSYSEKIFPDVPYIALPPGFSPYLV
jgi:hypothetical protein